MKRQITKSEYATPAGGRQGFTIAELLAVIMIIALLGGVGGGVYVNSHRRTLVEKAARHFLVAAKYARILAIEQQRPCKLRLDTENKTFVLTRPEYSTQTEETEELIVRDLYFKPATLEGDVQFEAIEIVPTGQETTDDEDEMQSTIVFRPNGTSQWALVQIGDGKTHYTVSVSAATGKARIEFGTADNVEFTYFDLDEE